MKKNHNQLKPIDCSKVPVQIMEIPWSFFFICSEFCHTLEWNSHGFTCVPHPDPPSHLPLHPLPPGFPSAPGPSACLMHPTWAGDMICIVIITCSKMWEKRNPFLVATKIVLRIKLCENCKWHVGRKPLTFFQDAETPYGRQFINYFPSLYINL